MIRNPLKLLQPPVEKLSHFQLLKTLLKNPMLTIPESVYEHSVVKLSYFGRHVFFICEPKLVRQILVTQTDSFPKHPSVQNGIGDTIGGSLFNVHGRAWSEQRKLFQHAMNDMLSDINIEKIHKITRNYIDNIDSKQKLEFHDLTRQVTLNIILEMLAPGIQFDQKYITKCIDDYLLGISSKAVLHALKLPPWLWHPNKKRTHLAILEARRVAERILDSGAVSPLLQAHHQLERKNAIANIISFISAGHETTALLVTWAAYILCIHNNLQNDIRLELKDYQQGVLSPKSKTLDGVINESLRLFPPGPIIIRTNKTEVVSDDIVIPKHSPIIIPLYQLHRHKQWWVNPDMVDLAKCNIRKEKVFMPFGSGPRFCIGANLAMTEARIILAQLIQRYYITLGMDDLPEPHLSLTLRPIPGLYLKLQSVQ